MRWTGLLVVFGVWSSVGCDPLTPGDFEGEPLFELEIALPSASEGALGVALVWEGQVQDAQRIRDGATTHTVEVRQEPAELAFAHIAVFQDDNDDGAWQRDVEPLVGSALEHIVVYAPSVATGSDNRWSVDAGFHVLQLDAAGTCDGEGRVAQTLWTGSAVPITLSSPASLRELSCVSCEQGEKRCGEACIAETACCSDAECGQEERCSENVCTCAGATCMGVCDGRCDAACDVDYCGTRLSLFFDGELVYCGAVEHRMPDPVYMTLLPSSIGIQQSGVTIENVTVDTLGGERLLSETFDVQGSWEICHGANGTAEISDNAARAEADWAQFRLKSVPLPSTDGLVLRATMYWGEFTNSFLFVFREGDFSPEQCGPSLGQLTATFDLQEYDILTGPPVGGLRSTLFGPFDVSTWTKPEVGFHQVEARFESTCVCGNGVVEPGELCDDSNRVDDDGCSSRCLAEGPSCKAILAAHPEARSEVYRLDPDGAGGEAPFDGYCEMERDGGGWTMLYSNHPDRWDPLKAEAFLSTDPASDQEHSLFWSMSSSARRTLPFEEVMFVHAAHDPDAIYNPVTPTVSVYAGSATSLLALPVGSTLAYDETRSTGRIPLGSCSGLGTYNPDALYYRQPGATERGYVFSHYDGDGANQAGIFCATGTACDGSIFGDCDLPEGSGNGLGFVQIFAR